MAHCDRFISLPGFTRREELIQTDPINMFV